MFFIFINSILVNFTKTNSERILQQNVKHNLIDIISSYCEENKINFSFYMNIINYINDRKKFVEDKNRKGDIYFKESEFNCGREFDIKSSNSSKTSGIGLQYLADNSRYTYKSFSISDLKDASDSMFVPSSMKLRRSGKIPQIKLSEEGKQFLEMKDQEFEKTLKSYSESLESLYYNPSEIKLEPVNPYSTPPVDEEFTKDENGLP